MKTYDKSGVAGAIILPEALQRLVDFTPDHELLLAEKLCFHLFVWPNELCWMDSSAFRLDASGEPIGLNVGRDLLNPRSRVIPIDPPHRAVFRTLLPRSGPLFHGPDPFARLQRLGSNLQIKLSQCLALRSVMTYARCAGLSANEITARACVRPRPLAGQLLSPGARARAEEYFAVDFHLSRSALRPRYCGPDAVPRQLIWLAPKDAGCTHDPGPFKTIHWGSDSPGCALTNDGSGQCGGVWAGIGPGGDPGMQHPGTGSNSQELHLRNPCGSMGFLLFPVFAEKNGVATTRHRNMEAPGETARHRPLPRLAIASQCV